MTKNDVENSDFSISVEKPPKKANSENSYAESPETDDITVDDEGDVVKFNNKFTCLGSINNFVLDDTVDT